MEEQGKPTLEGINFVDVGSVTDYGELDPMVLIKKYIAKLRDNCKTGDTEIDHEKADRVLCELLEEIGMEDVVNEYSTIDRWFA